MICNNSDIKSLNIGSKFLFANELLSNSVPKQCSSAVPYSTQSSSLFLAHLLLQFYSQRNEYKMGE